MKAIVYHGTGNIAVENVPEPKIVDEGDAIIQLTASAICGTDLHFVRGSIPGMQECTILGHEGVGVVREVGKSVRNLKPGDRVVVGSTICCGYCSYCRASYFSKCDNANPNGPEHTAFYGGPKDSGPFHGLQAEYARIPFASVNALKLPDGVDDDDAILLSDIMPTAYFAADMAHVKPARTVAILGCGPVGQMAIASAKLMDAGRIIAIDAEPDRLDVARRQGAEAIDFSTEDPVQAVKELTGGIGVDCAIDCVGVDADKQRHSKEQWKAGTDPDAPLEWAVDMVAKAGTVSVVGVYPSGFKEFDFGKAFGKNLTIRMGDCPHRRYLPRLIRLVASGALRPSGILTNVASFEESIDAYKAFDLHSQGWLKVELLPDRRPSATKGELVTA